MISRSASLVFHCLLAALALALLGPGTAQAASLPRDDREIDTERLLEELDAIEQRREDLFMQGLSRRIQEIVSRSQTEIAAVDLWQEAIKGTQYDGKIEGGREYAEWKEKQTEIHLDPLFKKAVKLHIDYLVLTLNRINGVETEDMLPEIEAYTRRLNELLLELDNAEAPDTKYAEEIFSDRERARLKSKGRELPSPKHARQMLKTGLNGSAMVRWHQLEPFMEKVEKWEMSPGNIEGIVSNVLMPAYREQLNPRLLSLWDERMERAQREAGKEGLNVEVEKYETEIGPEMEWSKAQDMIYLGLGNRARAQMMMIIRTHPSHKNFQKWVDELRDRLGSPDGLTKGERAKVARAKKKAAEARGETPPAPEDTAATPNAEQQPANPDQTAAVGSQ